MSWLMVAQSVMTYRLSKYHDAIKHVIARGITTSKVKLRPYLELTKDIHTSPSRANFWCLLWVIWRKDIGSARKWWLDTLWYPRRSLSSSLPPPSQPSLLLANCQSWAKTKVMVHCHICNHWHYFSLHISLRISISIISFLHGWPWLSPCINWNVIFTCLRPIVLLWRHQ